MLNAMTVDVEDYFQVSAFESHIPRSDWSNWPQRVERNMHRLLEMFDDADVSATFFTLSWIAERYPNIIRELVAQGHELASHGCEHIRVRDQSEMQFLEDAAMSKKTLEDIAAVEVTGYRAASFSIGAETPWAHAALERAGYRYTSSVYPVRHDHYGSPNAIPTPHRPSGLGIIEFPPSTHPFLGRNLPCAGGGYFRLLPYGVSRWGLSRAQRIRQAPVVFYMHPWEIDLEQPRVPGVSVKTRFRHYVGLARTEARLARLLGDFRWGRMDEVCSRLADVADGARPGVLAYVGQ